MSDRPTNREITLAVARTAALVAVAVLVYAVVPVHGTWEWVTIALAVGGQVAIVPVTVRRARRIRRSARPLLDAMMTMTGFIVVLVLGFSALYVVLAQHPDQVQGLDTRLDAVYFTASTLATVGPGDIHAQGQAARAVVLVQMVANVVVIVLGFRFLGGIARQTLATERTAGEAPAP